MPAAPPVSAEHPDWSRECPRRWWASSRRLLHCVRRYQAASSLPQPWRRLVQRRWALSHRFWSVVTLAEIQLTIRIGGGLLLPHPNGIVNHPAAVIGPNRSIFKQVTLGTREEMPGVPVLGGHVDVGAGASILGPVTIGDPAVIGANAMVLWDVPAGAVAVGIPARVRLQRPNRD